MLIISIDPSKLNAVASSGYQYSETMAEDSDASDDEGVDTEDMFPMKTHESTGNALSEDIEHHLATLNPGDKSDDLDGPEFITLDNPSASDAAAWNMMELDDESDAFPDGEVTWIPGKAFCVKHFIHLLMFR